MSHKRRHTSPSADCSDPKRRRTQNNPVVIDEDEDEQSLEEILRLIKQHEDSEALARELQQEWESPDPKGVHSAVPAAGTSRSPICIIDDENTESDEAMARRLAREWGTLGTLGSPIVAAETPEVAQYSHSRKPATAISSRSSKETIPAAADEQLRPHRQLFIATRSCTNCSSDIESPRGSVSFKSQSLPPSLVQLLHAYCRSCKTNHCRGCFKPVQCAKNCKGDSKSKNVGTCAVRVCCTEGRVIALFEALGGFDRVYLGERLSSEARSKVVAEAHRGSTSGSVGPGGTGYGMDFNHGGGRRPGGSSASKSKTKKLADHFDQLVVRALNTIIELLPSPYSDEPQAFDILPHVTTGPLILMSQLPNLLAGLLRNDSVTDWSSRSEIYYVMLSLLRKMADCELTVQALISERLEILDTNGIDDWMWNGSEITWAKEKGQFVMAKPLYVHFHKLTRQCETFLASSSQLLDATEDAGPEAEAIVKTTSLCGEIITARDAIKRTMTILGQDPHSILEGYSISASETQTKTFSKGKGVSHAVELQRRYARECERLAFKHIAFPEIPTNSIQAVYANFHYRNMLVDTVSSTRNPKDRLHLVRELAVMATSLPPGVWVCVDEVRNDALKIMIAGPEDTPYAGGLFEFDCFVPIQYPKVPPQMHLRTTGGGTVRFNPNLYNSGEVCLSLLGTWPGRPEERWSPKSTLLQVLVSIQSMILVDLPFFNEPGYGKADPNNPNSQLYNRDISLQTVRWAIVEWLKHEHQSGIWADVIATHFTIMEDKIRNNITKWSQNEPKITRMGLLAQFNNGMKSVRSWKKE